MLIKKMNFTFAHDSARMVLADGRTVTPRVAVVYTDPDWVQREDGTWTLNLLVEYEEGDRDDENFFKCAVAVTAEMMIQSLFETPHWRRNVLLSLKSEGGMDGCEEVRLRLMVPDYETVISILDGETVRVYHDFPCFGVNPEEKEVVVPVHYYGNNVCAADRTCYERVQPVGAAD